MHFFHLSDLHIGLRLYNRDMGEDQRYVLSQVVRHAQEMEPDAVVIAGDLYDRAVPSAEAVQLFDEFLANLTDAVPGRAIMMVSGNHDSQSRVDLYRSILKRENIHMIGVPPAQKGEQIATVTLQDTYGPVRFYLLPFVKPSMIRNLVGTTEDKELCSYDESVRRLLGAERVDSSIRNVLVSHQFYLPVGADANSIARTDTEIVTVGNIDQIRSDVLEPFDYAALGHIHRPMRVGSEVFRYCGSPLPCSFSEEGQQKAILDVTMMEKGKIEVKEIPLQPLHAVRTVRGTPEEVLAQPSLDYIRVELTEGRKTQTDPVSGAGSGSTEKLLETDLQEALRLAFPNLLEIRRVFHRQKDRSADFSLEEEEMNPYRLCRDFLPEDIGEERLELLREIINTAQGGET